MGKANLSPLHLPTGPPQCPLLFTNHGLQPSCSDRMPEAAENPFGRCWALFMACLRTLAKDPDGSIILNRCGTDASTNFATHISLSGDLEAAVVL